MNLTIFSADINVEPDDDSDDNYNGSDNDGDDPKVRGWIYKTNLVYLYKLSKQLVRFEGCDHNFCPRPGYHITQRGLSNSFPELVRLRRRARRGQKRHSVVFTASDDDIRNLYNQSLQMHEVG